MKRFFILLGVLVLANAGQGVRAQGFFTDSIRAARAEVNPKELANPSVLGMGKSKGVIIRYE